MNKREFIALIGGAAAAWPIAAGAQQPDRARRIGVLMGTAESDPDQKAMVSVFTRALEDLGWKEGANIRIDTFASDSNLSWATRNMALVSSLFAFRAAPSPAAHSEECVTQPAP
jgi:hypothetical protein